jgi:hypothetical protein
VLLDARYERVKYVGQVVNYAILVAISIIYKYDDVFILEIHLLNSRFNYAILYVYL